MTVPEPDQQLYGHTLGVNIFTMSQDPLYSNHSLCRASLLIAIRQEIFISFNTRKPPQPLAQRCGIVKSIDPADDYTWAWRIIIHTEAVLSSVYGETTQSIEEWDELSRYLDDWERYRPPSFNPVWSSEGSDRFFPEVIFANDFHVAGQQYADICRILLVAHDPRILSLGLDRLEFSRSLDVKIRQLVRNLCGIATSNTKHQPALFTAGMAVAACGDWFTSREEQEQLIEVVRAAEAHMGWAFLKQQERLCELWGLTQSPNE
ncbi:hypothetical protein ACHAPJ_011387 [Fusarium lateritium]